MDVTDNSISPVPLAGSSLNTPSEQCHVDQGLPAGNGSCMDGRPDICGWGIRPTSVHVMSVFIYVSHHL